MALPVLIIGKSGTGKSTSMRNFKDGEIKLINVLGKSLPFRKKFSNIVDTDDYKKVAQEMKDAEENIIVVDDSGYLITNMFMKNQGQKKGNLVFDFYNELAVNFWKLLNYVKSLPKNKIVYFIMHEDVNDAGEVKPKTIGKMLDEKVDIPGMFTFVFRALKSNGKYIFRTQSNGYDVAKSPMGMFNGEEIENDLAKVTEIIRDYYAESVEEEKINE